MTKRIDCDGGQKAELRKCGCDYILHKKQRRGCSVECCDKHEKGETKKRRRHIHI